MPAPGRGHQMLLGALMASLAAVARIATAVAGSIEGLGLAF